MSQVNGGESMRRSLDEISPQPEYPSEVTINNWAIIQEEGFSHITNLGWPLETLPHSLVGVSDTETVKHLEQRYGDLNVKLGHMLHNGIPDFSGTTQFKMIGVYVNKGSSA